MIFPSGKKGTQHDFALSALMTTDLYTINLTGPKRYHRDSSTANRSNHPGNRRVQHFMSSQYSINTALHQLDEKVLLIGHPKHVFLPLSHVGYRYA
jgi:hypothetical protein